MPFQRLRVTYRNTSCSERPGASLGRVWADSFEAAGLALARPEGSKRARVETAPPLPQHATGEAELVDVLLGAPVDPVEAVRRLTTRLPRGLEALHAEEIGERLPSLNASTRAARYRAIFRPDQAPDDVGHRVERLLGLPMLDWEELRGERLRRFDLRALVYDLALHEEDGCAVLEMRLALSQEGAGRPASVIAALGIGAPDCLVRTAIEVERPLIAIRAWRERGRFA
ncbi:MAG: DUF2344 domain-containing protein [Dehalococcoidia bacterium]